jgi:hypothetical protein
VRVAHGDGWVVQNREHEFCNHALGLARLLIGLGGVAAALIVRSLVTGIRSEYRTLSARRLILRFGSSALSIVGLIAIGGVFVGDDFQDGFAWLSGIAIFLLLTSLRNSWDLLVSVGRAIQAPSHS